jgi:8-oxo-dGTP pyrophosphatase MutT (NUDIX family)
MTTDLGVLQTRAARDGRRCAVGAIVLDDEGRVFVHRRGWDRALLPGCWDIVGGHVEPGEQLLDALRREIREETGWELAGTPQLAHVSDWEAEDGGRREFDFLVDVDGDLSQPRLEWPQHVEFRWVDPTGLDVLAENRALDGGLVRRLVELGLRSSPRGELRSPQATVFLDPASAVPIELLRAEWDPASADQIAAHVTLADPDEAGEIDVLAGRLAAAAAAVTRFRLRLGAIVPFGPAQDGLAVEVEDLDGGWAALGASAGAERATFAPRVTVVDPRTTNRGPAAWQTLRGTSFDTDATVREVCVTAFDGRRWQTVASYPLGTGA